MEELTFCCDCANMDKETEKCKTNPRMDYVIGKYVSWNCLIRNSDGKCVDYKKEGK